MPDAFIPDEVLSRADLREALRTHDLEGAFRVIVKYAGISQNRIALACGLTPGKVSTIMSGRTRVTSYEVLVRIADGLRVPGDLLGLATRPWEAEAQPMDENVEAPLRMEMPWQAGATVDFAARLARSDLAMDRRSLARALAAGAFTGAALLDSLEGWLRPAAEHSGRRRPGRLGLREVEQLEEAAAVFRAWDHRYGGGLRRKAVVGQLAEVAAALSEHQAPEVERRLYRVLAQLSGTAATMSWDSGFQRSAQDYYRLSLRAAHAGDDRLWGANVLAGMARQMLYAGRPHDALELVRFAQEGARQESTPRVSAMLHTREAWAFAALGRFGAFERATEQAKDALADAGEGTDPHWITYFDWAELAGVTGGRLLELARHDARLYADNAATEIRRAIELRDPGAGRSNALDRLGLAEAYFLGGHLNTACEETHTAAEAAGRVRSGRVREGMASLYAYTVGHGSSPKVREARNRLREQLAD
jgi:transcriptional regulator with XRE-family HTH domain